MKPQIVRHGEVLLYPVQELPKEVKLEKIIKRHIVAHSETGHHHTLVADKVDFKVFSWNGETYLEVPEMSELLHEKNGKDVHTPHKIVPAFHKVIIKKSFNYFSRALEKVRD